MSDKAIYLFMLIISIGLAQCNTINVSQNSSIQLQLDGASPNDVILVGNGTFYENLIINKSIILRSINGAVIDGRGNGGTITLAEDGVMVEGFTIKNSGSEGISIISNNNILRNNTVEGCQIGIDVIDSNGNIIEANTIRNNEESGVLIKNSSNTSLNYNYIYSNTVEGLAIYDCRDTAIVGNNASKNGYGMYIMNSATNDIAENRLFMNNNKGIYLSKVTKSAITNNSIENNKNYGIQISNLFNGSFSGNYLYNNQETGAYISKSQLNMIQGNNASNNKDVGIYIEKSDNNMILENQACNNKNVGIYLRILENSTIKGNKALNNTIGLAFYDASNNSILNNFVDINLWRGISFESNSNNNTIIRNNISKSGMGMVLLESMYNKIDSNNIDNSFGVALQKATYNIILNNNITYNKIGLYLNRSDHNLIGENDFDHNEVGLAINVSANNALENRTFNNSDYDVIVNENETISGNPLWKRIILKRHPEYYLQPYLKETRFIENPDFSADSSSGSGGRTSNDGGSGPSISVSIQSICDAYFDSLGAGRMLLNAPDKMNQSESYTVEAYIPRNYTLNLSSDPSLTGVDRWFNLSKVGEYMGLKLEGGSAFSINPAEEVEQYIPNGQVGTWTWEVTPLLAGEQKLTLKVTTYYKHNFDQKGIPASASFHRGVEVMPEEIVVQVDETPPTKDKFNDILAIAGGIVGLFISILTLIKLYGEVSKRKKE